MKNSSQIWILLGISVVLMSIPFLVPHTGCLALIGFIPLLCADKIASDNHVRLFWLMYYAFFLAWNLVTTFWVCNATVGGGLFASFANALQMALVFGLFRISKRRFKGVLPYIFLAVTWIAWERYYLTSAQISWPWLVLGNAFATSTGCVQWYEYTGTLGGSLLVWASNLGIFGLMIALGDGRYFEKWNIKARIAAPAALAILIIGPLAGSLVLFYKTEETSAESLQCLVIQPNIDPYNKFEFLTQEEQNEILVDMIDSSLSDTLTPTLILAPETFTGDVVVNDIPSSRTWQTMLGALQRHPNANLLFGASSHEYITASERPSYTARVVGKGLWRESHNSALMMDPSGETSIFHKSKLVVGVEMTPYPKFFTKIDDRLGGVMGRDIGQKEVSLLCFKPQEGAEVPLGCAVCYESIYGEYCTEYVRKGARALAVITNDAWWGDTPGYVQHCSYSRLRAIETRRDIVRCANTGISCFIDQKGRITSKTDWWKKQTLLGTVNLNDKVTFFVRYGDIVGRVCYLCFLLLGLYLIVAMFIKKQ